MLKSFTLVFVFLFFPLIVHSHNLWVWIHEEYASQNPNQRLTVQDIDLLKVFKKSVSISCKTLLPFIPQSIFKDTPSDADRHQDTSF